MPNMSAKDLYARLKIVPNFYGSVWTDKNDRVWFEKDRETLLWTMSFYDDFCIKQNIPNAVDLEEQINGAGFKTRKAAIHAFQNLFGEKISELTRPIRVLYEIEDTPIGIDGWAGDWGILQNTNFSKHPEFLYWHDWYLKYGTPIGKTRFEVISKLLQEIKLSKVEFDFLKH